MSSGCTSALPEASQGSVGGAVGCLRVFAQKPNLTTCPQMLVPLLLQYLETLSGLVDSNLNCGPVLTWMEVGRSRGA